MSTPDDETRWHYRRLLRLALEKSPFRRKVFRIGKYYADYSALTDADLDAIPNHEDLFRNSRSINSIRRRG